MLHGCTHPDADPHSLPGSDRETGSSYMGEVGLHFQTLKGNLLLRSLQSFRCHYLVELEGSPCAAFLVNASPSQDVLMTAERMCSICVTNDTYRRSGNRMGMFYRPADKRKCQRNSPVGTQGRVSPHALVLNYSAHLATLGCLSQCCPHCPASTAACLQRD